jgi:hypothetical protein
MCAAGEMYVPFPGAAAVDDRRTIPRAQVAHRLTTLSLAAAGALAGHELGYALAPLAGATSTSHDHLDLALRILPVLGLVAFARRALGDEERTAWTRRHLTVGRLAALQLGIFFVLEGGERLGQGVALSELAGPQVLVGAAVQVPIAAAVLLGLLATRRVVARLLDRWVPVVPVLAGHVVVRPAVAPRRRTRLRALGPRAPPSPARPS